MKNICIVLIIALPLLVLSSCNYQTKKELNISEVLEKSAEDGRLIITDKIMYDVPVVNDIIGDRTKNNPDWFWQNLPSPEGDNFIEALIDDAVSGRIKTYYFDPLGDYEVLEEIPQNELKSFMDKNLTFTFEILDTISSDVPTPKQIVIPLDHTNVKQLRFLEEWSIDKKGNFNKKVIAIAPFFRIEHPDLYEPMNSIYFWISLDRN